MERCNDAKIMEMVDNISLFAKFQYSKIKKSFPQCWYKKKCADSDEDDESCIEQFKIKTGDVIDMSKMKTKPIYSMIIEMKDFKPMFFGWWERKLNLSRTFCWSSLIRFKFGEKKDK